MSKFSSRRLIEIGLNSFPEIFCLDGMAKVMAGRITVLRPVSLTEFTEIFQYSFRAECRAVLEYSLQKIKVSLLLHQVKLLIVDSTAPLVLG
ncbi:hypothetical protein L6452_42642 [Arctium lappa]|uniref:Uncharacterized protein n=1 Tax=Arctium lappa TaxID=4217 RepID=A0ACB8XMY2_ARCLA|nr:hypothetical protein L6452_42642 [Arctium lappa]